MAAPSQSLIEKLRALPADRIAEVEDFVDFLSAKAQRQAALDRLIALAPAMEAAGADPISEENILAEVEAVRAPRRGRSGADRS